MEKNNGKIAIAIVAMFVVALSVVGFTYAYFVARVQGNTNTNVTVTAGTLSVEYASTQEIKAVNLVPGWQSDGKHYFDSAATETTEDGKVKYSACVIGDTTDTRGCDDSKAIPANGLSDAATFTVTNTSTARAAESTVSYVVILNGISNGLAISDTDEASKFHYALCKGTCPEAEIYSEVPAPATNNNVVSKGEIADTEKVQVISSVQTLDKDTTTANVLDTQNYELMLYYDNVDSEQDGTGKTVSAKIDIIGVAQNAEKWYDANGVEITPLS